MKFTYRKLHDIKFAISADKVFTTSPMGFGKLNEEPSIMKTTESSKEDFESMIPKKLDHKQQQLLDSYKGAR